MKAIVKIQIEIPVEYEEFTKEVLLKRLQQYFNRNFNKTSVTSGNYSWKFPNKNAEIIEIVNA